MASSSQGTISQGKVLAIDYGLRRVGLAITDVGRTMVFPRPVLLNEGQEGLFSSLKKMCQNESVSLLVLGLPYDDRHVETDQTARMKVIGERLSTYCGLPLIYEDEKYTSAEAEALMDSYGFDFKQKKSQRDSVAAMLILQTYLSKV